MSQDSQQDYDQTGGLVGWGSKNGIKKRLCGGERGYHDFTESKNFFQNVCLRGSKGKESRIWFFSFNLFLPGAI